jgi:hypothetical protein
MCSLKAWFGATRRSSMQFTIHRRTGDGRIVWRCRRSQVFLAIRKCPKRDKFAVEANDCLQESCAGGDGAGAEGQTGGPQVGQRWHTAPAAILRADCTSGRPQAPGSQRKGERRGHQLRGTGARERPSYRA